MDLKKTAAILIVFILLGSYYYFVEIKQAAKKEQQQSEGKKLFRTFDPGAVTSFSFTRDKQTIALSKDRYGIWNITAPRALKADQTAVRTWLSALAGVEKTEVIDENPADPAAYGLAASALSIHAQTVPRAAPVDLLIGTNNYTNQLAYARLGQEKQVLAIPVSDKSNLDKTLYDLRNKEVIPVYDETIKKIEIKSAGIRFLLEKNKDSWFLKKPLTDLASKGRVSRLFTDLRATTIREFVQEPLKTPARYGLDNPAKQIILWEGLQKVVLNIGKKDSNLYYASRSGVSDCVKIDSYVVDNLPLKADDWIEKHLAFFQPYQISKVDVDSPAVSFKAEIQDNKWNITSRTKQAVTPQDVDNLLSGIQALEFQQRLSAGSVSETKAGWAVKPAGGTISWTIKGESGQPDKVQTLLLGNKTKDGKSCYARLQDQPDVYLIDASFLGKFPAHK